MTCGFPERAVYNAHVDSPKLRDFLGNVFKQVDVDKYMEIYCEAVRKGDSPEEIYSELLGQAPHAQGGMISKLRMGLTALSGERKTLADNVAKVMDPNRPKDGYVEIGMPGRMIKSLKPLMGLKGRITVVSESESLIQSGFPRPYDAFHQLTYDPLPLKERSVDVISAFPGLHHCPEDKLDAFIASIHRTLREGGTFLLREHDARDKEMLDLATVVHSAFNSATGVSVKDEGAEVRNFKSLSEWKDILATHGFRCASEPLIRAGDSSENALLKFVKVGGKEDQVREIREKLIAKKSSYTRPREQTHLTNAEWFNVESAQNLGKAKSFWSYPYFKDIGRLWKGFAHSWKAARSVASWSKLAKSEYTVINAVILTMMTCEYVAKGILCTPLYGLAKLGALLPKRSDQTWERPARNYQKWLEKYSQQLEITPFYAQRYIPRIGGYWSELAKSWSLARKERSFLNLMTDRQTVKNIVTGVAMTADLVARSAIASVINAFVGGEENGDDREIALIVKGSVQSRDGIHVIKEEGNPYRGVISPRYQGLQAYLTDLARDGVEIVEIAGQTEIQIDVVVDRDEQAYSKETLYQRDYLADASKKILALQVKVEDLPGYMTGAHVHRVYDF